MLKGDAKAHTDMLDRYVGRIRMHYEYMLGRYREDVPVGKATEFRMDSNVLYGTEEAEKLQLFGKHEYKAYVCELPMSFPTQQITELSAKILE